MDWPSSHRGTVLALTADAPVPAGGRWPDWLFDAPHVAAAHPQQRSRRPLETGANCQAYAYAVLRLYGRSVPEHRSSDLWTDPSFDHPPAADVRDLDLVLFNATAEPWAAHVAVYLAKRLLHLCAEVGKPAAWSWDDFAARDRYRVMLGLVRVPLN